MNATAALTRASQFGGSFILGAGAAMLTVALISSSSGTRPQAAPAPTVTVTPPPQVVTVSPSPAPTPKPRATATLVVQRATARPPPTARAPGSTGGASGGAMRAEQTPPDQTTSPSQCTGRIAAVTLPLGVLDDCAITVGGNR
jgi:hypothetical protein